MRKIIPLLTLLLTLSSCDPMYYMLISNRTDEDKWIQLKAFTNPISYHENIENIFKPGELVMTDSLKSMVGFNSVLLPAHQSIRIQGLGIGHPKGEAIILNEVDTIYATTFAMKGGFFSFVKWAYPIENK